MDDRRAEAPAAIVPELPRGANGIPEALVEDEMMDDTLVTTTRSNPARAGAADSGLGAYGTGVYGTTTSDMHDTSDTVLSWFAFSLIVIGAIGAIAGAIQSAGRRRRMSWQVPGDHYELTPPHGDKLHPLL